MKLLLVIIVCLTFGTLACENDTQSREALVDLFREEKKLQCQLASMKDSIVTEWDNMNHMLESQLPPEMPAEEKNNMLKVRNSSLIRMFQSYEGLNEEVKSALDDLEQRDRKMAERLGELKQEIQRIESEKMLLLQKLQETNGNDAIEEINTLNQAILTENC
ncbi:MAG: hypothetical protein GYB31_01550 [Bacteroidetes bacterium]|nr:hypothetical protein [Bacteroidota bacterium]